MIILPFKLLNEFLDWTAKFAKELYVLKKLILLQVHFPFF